MKEMLETKTKITNSIPSNEFKIFNVIQRDIFTPNTLPEPQ
jgi:hypothetical protein